MCQPEKSALADRQTPKTTTTSSPTILREGAGGQAVATPLVYPPFHNNNNKPPTTTTTTTTTRYFTRKDIADKLAADPHALWIILHRSVYELTDYYASHPGGQLVLRHYNGRDATDAFENYHRAHVVKFLLPRYYRGELQGDNHVHNENHQEEEDDNNPVIPTNDDTPPHVLAFRELKQEMLRRGMFTVPVGYYYRLYAWLAFLFFSAVTCTVYGQHCLPVQMLGAVLLGLFWQQYAGLGHDTGHTAVTKQYATDHWMGSSLGAALTGLSTAWWKHNHNTHHVVPNAIEHDPNIQHLPLMAISQAVIEQPYRSTYHERDFWLSRVGTAVVSYQHYLFLPLMAVARFNLYALGLKHLLHLVPTAPPTAFRSTELLAILGVFPLWYGALACRLPTRTTMLAWMVLSHAVTMLLHLQIVVSHWSMESYRAVEVENDNNDKASLDKTKGTHNKQANDNDDWYMLQFRTTMDIACPPWMDWLHIGLQFQTAHHLYPTLPRPHLRTATRMVKQVCAQHGIVFSEMPFWAMVADSWRVLKETALLARTGQYTHHHHRLLAQAWRAEG